MIVINSILFVLITIMGSVTYGNDFNIGTDPVKFSVEADTGAVETEGGFWGKSYLIVGEGISETNSTIITGGHIGTTGTITGDGSGLTSLNASNISSGTLHANRLPSHAHNYAAANHGFSWQTGNLWTLETNSDHTQLWLKYNYNSNTSTTKLISYDNGFIVADQNDTTMVVKQTNGNKYAIFDGDNNWEFISDRRLKTEIEIETNILERIMEIDVVSYKFKDGLQFRKQLGFLAQDIEPHFPLLITEQEDEKYDFKVKTLGYSTFGVLAFGGIRELKIEKDREIDALKAENETLKATIDALTQRIEALENR